MGSAAVAWGVIGPGDVVEHKSGPALQSVPGSQLLAVAGRTPSRTEDFAARHGVPRWYATPAELLADADVDAVYVATPPGATMTTRSRRRRRASTSTSRSRWRAPAPSARRWSRRPGGPASGSSSPITAGRCRGSWRRSGRCAQADWARSGRWRCSSRMCRTGMAAGGSTRRRPAAVCSSTSARTRSTGSTCCSVRSPCGSPRSTAARPSRSSMSS